jgi:hypothetical protein
MRSQHLLSPLRSSTVTLALALLLASACSDSTTSGDEHSDTGGEDPGGYLTIETALGATEVTAGDVVLVTCRVLDPDGSELDLATSVWVSPAAGISVSEHTLSTAAAGEYEVACQTEDPPLLDATMERLTVLAGPVAEVKAVPQDSVIAAGEATTVDCIATDAFGNPVEVETVVVEQPGLEVSGHSVQGVTAGTYKVECDVPSHKGVTSVAGPLEVTGGVPAAIDLIVIPAKEVYELGAVVDFEWVVTDAEGNVLSDVPATLTGPTEGVKALNGNKYKLNAEGHHTFTVTLDPPAPGLSDSETLLTDESAPEIVITWPERGATIQGGPTDDVVVEGYVLDAAGVEAFTINGVPVALEADGTFAHPMAPVWGLNPIMADAIDVLGQASHLSPAFYYSTQFLVHPDSASPGDVRLDDGMALLLGQPALDDGVHDPADIDDFATLFELVLGLLDLNALLPAIALPPFGADLPDVLAFEVPGPLGSTIGIQGDLAFELVIGQPVIGKPSVSLDSRVGGIDMEIGLGNPGDPAFFLPVAIVVSAPVTITVSFPDPFGGPPNVLAFDTVGSATLETGFMIEHVGILSSIDIDKAPGADAVIEVVDIVFSMEGAGVAPITEAIIDFGSLDVPFLGSIPLELDLMAVAPGLFDFVTTLTLDPLWDAIEPSLSGLVEPLVDGLVGGLLGPLFGLLDLETTLPLGDPLGTGTELALGVALGLDSIHFTDDGGTLGLGFGLTSDKGVERDPLGMPLRDGCLNGSGDGPLAYDWSSDAGLAMKVDAANSLLYAVWWSGLLSSALDPALLGGLLGGGGGGAGGIDTGDIGLEADFLLPPILTDCTASGKPEIQIGDLYLDVKIDALGFPIKAKLFVDASLEAQLVGSPDGLSLVIGEFTFIDVEVLSVGGGLGDLFDVSQLIEDMLMPFLLDSLPGTTLGPIPLPPIDVSGLLPGIPPGTSFGLHDFAVTEQSGYFVIGGSF